MELSWSTFLLEVINFLVLIWILKHFLYKPVLAIIAKRQEGIDKTLEDAQTLRGEAEQLQQQYEARLDHWDRERQQAREALKSELSAERTRRMDELQATLETEREKHRVAEQRRIADTQRRMEETAMTHGARFAGRVLEQAASPELEARLVEMAVAELTQLSHEQLAALHAHNGADGTRIKVLSAYPLSDQQRRQLQHALDNNGWQANLTFAEDPSLLAGLHITMGAWVLAANLRDELRGFSELASREQ